MTKKNKSQKQEQYELLYGAHSIIELLKAKKRKLHSIYTTKPLPKAWKRIEKYLPKNIPNIQYINRNTLDKMAGTTEHMGVVALVSPFKYLLKPFDPTKKQFVLMLDGIKDVRNLGAILRSAYCTGVQGVILCKKGGATITAAAHKASAGLVEHLNIYMAPSAQSAAHELKKAGYNLYMSVFNGKNATRVPYKKPLCLVIGSEELGISKSIQKLGNKITLPQAEPDISYNASVAAGILLFLVSQK